MIEIRTIIFILQIVGFYKFQNSYFPSKNNLKYWNTILTKKNPKTKSNKEIKSQKNRQFKNKKIACDKNTHMFCPTSKLYFYCLQCQLSITCESLQNEWSVLQFFTFQEIK